MFSLRNKKKISLNCPQYTLLSGALALLGSFTVSSIIHFGGHFETSRYLRTTGFEYSDAVNKKYVRQAINFLKYMAEC